MLIYIIIMFQEIGNKEKISMDLEKNRLRKRNGNENDI